MVKITGPTNEELKQIIGELKKGSSVNDVELWRRIADDLSKPSRQRREVNLSRLNRFTKDNETIVVPGKVLGSGVINHGIIVAAFSFSTAAKQGIESAKGKCITIEELFKKNPKGTGVKLIG